jgi:hypothetical protein
MVGVVQDIFVFGGLGMTLYASWHAWGPDGLVVPGVMLFVLGLLLEWQS